MMACRAAGLQGLLVGVVRVMAREDLHRGGHMGGSPSLALPSSPSSPGLHVILVYRESMTGEHVTTCGATCLQSSMDFRWCGVVMGSMTPMPWEEGAEWRVARDGERAEMASGDVRCSLPQTTAQFIFGVVLSGKSPIEGLVEGYTTVIVVVVVFSLGPSPSTTRMPILRYDVVMSACLGVQRPVMLCYVGWCGSRAAPPRLSGATSL